MSWVWGWVRQCRLGLLTVVYNQAYSCGDGPDKQCRLGLLTIMYNQAYSCGDGPDKQCRLGDGGDVNNDVQSGIIVVGMGQTNSVGWGC